MYQPITMCIYIGCIFSATSKNFCKQRIVYLSTRFTKPPSSSSPYCVAEIIAANILFLICFKFYQYHVVCICFRSLYIVGVGEVTFCTLLWNEKIWRMRILAQRQVLIYWHKYFLDLWLGNFFLVYELDSTFNGDYNVFPKMEIHMLTDFLGCAKSVY